MNVLRLQFLCFWVTIALLILNILVGCLSTQQNTVNYRSTWIFSFLCGFFLCPRGLVGSMLLNLFCIVFGRSLFGRCIVWPSSIYNFWLPIWYLQTFDHCIICPSIYGFWLTLWYLQTFVHCIVYPSIYGSWLPFGIYRLLSIALSILQSTVPDYPLVSSNFCPLHCLSFNLRFLITLWYLQTFVHCIVYPSIYGSWLPFGIYRLLSIALSILQSTVPDYPLVFTDFCPLHCLSFNLRFLITLWYLQTFVHCIVYPSIYGSWLPFGI